MFVIISSRFSLRSLSSSTCSECCLISKLTLSKACCWELSFARSSARSIFRRWTSLRVAPIFLATAKAFDFPAPCLPSAASATVEGSVCSAPPSLVSAWRNSASLLLAAFSRRRFCSCRRLSSLWAASTVRDSAASCTFASRPLCCASRICALTAASSFCVAARSSSTSSCRKDSAEPLVWASNAFLRDASSASCFSRSFTCSSETSSSPSVSASFSSAKTSFSLRLTSAAFVSAACTSAILFMEVNWASNSETCWPIREALSTS
mmetsp:Transcript_36146/g.84600  ORF Transcript_36146/g.84600 Transcript_36146/m.84600 type:complete len:265 (+) Transcript_36146:1436-2230(+)